MIQLCQLFFMKAGIVGRMSQFYHPEDYPFLNPLNIYLPANHANERE